MGVHLPGSLFLLILLRTNSSSGWPPSLIHVSTDKDGDDKGHRRENCLPSNRFLRTHFMHTKWTHSKAVPSSAPFRDIPLPRSYFLLSWDPMIWFSSEMPLHQYRYPSMHHCCSHLVPQMLQWFLIYFMMNCYYVLLVCVCVWTCVHAHECVQLPGHVWKSEDIFFFFFGS